ncbi:MAG: hypothetical protein ABEL51_13640, partial [Salinibacter sp.]
MPSTPTEKHKERWQTIVEDPLLSELPYKVETKPKRYGLWRRTVAFGFSPTTNWSTRDSSPTFRHRF